MVLGQYVYVYVHNCSTVFSGNKLFLGQCVCTRVYFVQTYTQDLQNMADVADDKSLTNLLVVFRLQENQI